MYYTCSYITLNGVDPPSIKKYNSEHAFSLFEFMLCQKHARRCKCLADKCQNLLADTSCICHFGKQIADQAIYLLFHVCNMAYEVSAKPEVDAAVAKKIDWLNSGCVF